MCPAQPFLRPGRSQHPCASLPAHCSEYLSEFGGRIEHGYNALYLKHCSGYIAYGCLWIPMDSYRSLLISVIFDGFVWIPVYSPWIPVIPLQSYGILGVSVVFYGFLWIPIDSC